MDLFPSDPSKHNCECPDCGGGDVTPTLTTTAGAYCQCGTCGHLWHEERRKNENGAIEGGRRRTDLPLS